MKKIIFLIILFTLYSCSNDLDLKNNNEKIIQENFNTKNIFKLEEITEGDIEEAKNIENEFNDLLKENDKKENNEKEIENLKYKEIVDYWKIENSKITKEFLENDIYFNKYMNKNNLFINLWFDNDILKLKKILKLVLDISKEWKIESFTLHCNNINFDDNDLKILKEINIDLLSLDSNCWFKKKEFNKNWYNQDDLIKFFKDAKYIKEIHIWYIEEDYFRKKSNIIEKLDRYNESRKWLEIN